MLYVNFMTNAAIRVNKMQSFIIKKMSVEHLDNIVDLEKQCFSVPWSKNLLEQELNNDNSYFLVAVDDNENVLGYIGFYHVCGEGYITNIAVFKQYRRNGIAKNLIESIINFGYENNLEFISLEVRKSNLSAISLYESFNFLSVGIRKDFYSLPKEDAVIMTYYLKKLL